MLLSVKCFHTTSDVVFDFGPLEFNAELDWAYGVDSDTTIDSNETIDEDDGNAAIEKLLSMLLLPINNSLSLCY